MHAELLHVNKKGEVVRATEQGKAECSHLNVSHLLGQVRRGLDEPRPVGECSETCSASPWSSSLTSARSGTCRRGTGTV